MNDPLLEEAAPRPDVIVGRPSGLATVTPIGKARPRERFELADDTGFDEVPKKYRRFYRRWEGEGDLLAANEVLCPVCKVVIRSTRELRVGDRVYCMPCMSRITVTRSESGRLEASVEY